MSRYETAIAHNGLENAIGNDSMSQVIRVTVVLVDDPVHTKLCRVNISQYQVVCLSDLFNDEIIHLGDIVVALFPMFGMCIFDLVHIVGIHHHDDGIDSGTNTIDERLISTTEDLRRRSAA